MPTFSSPTSPARKAASKVTATSNPASKRTRRTTQPTKGASRWFPQRKDFTSYQAWDTHYRAFEQIYALEDTVRQLASQVQAAQQATQQASNQAVSGLAGKLDKGDRVDATHINGFRVKATVPKDGQVLTYKAVEGQLVLE